ncbi:MAG TPA: fibronectin type III domain-containing protein, partial [Micromonosporaceae bacterium]
DLVVALVDDPASPAASDSGASAAPTLSGEPPTELKLREEGSTITITWTDPTAGTVPFIVAGGRAGQELRAMAQVSPGESTYKINGLNARVDYCFTVAAVYSTNRFGLSGQVCTARANPSPS